MKLSDVIHEMAELRRSEMGMGLTQYENEDFVLAGGFRSGNSGPGTTRLKYMIYDLRMIKAGHDHEQAEIGYVELFVEDRTGEIVGLSNIELKKGIRRTGYGKKIIRDIVDTTKSGLKVYDIQRKAKKFWDKIGVEYTDKAGRFGSIPKK